MKAWPILPLEPWLGHGDGASSVAQEGEGGPQTSPEQPLEYAGSVWGVCSRLERVPHALGKDCGCGGSRSDNASKIQMRGDGAQPTLCSEPIRATILLE